MKGGSLHLGNVSAIRREQVLAAFDPARLHLFLFPTERCNFRCTYCYEDFAIGRMSEPVVIAVKRLISTRFPGLRSLDVSWFGGEPLVAWRVVESISDHIVTERSAHPCVEYRADMTTNGYLLTPDRAARLIGLGVNLFQITLDGPIETHDRRRVTASGGGTFERIWDNLLRLRASDLCFVIHLRIHFAPDTVGSVASFCHTLNSAFGADERFAYLFRPLKRLGGKNDSTVEVFSPERAVEVRRELEGRVDAHRIVRLETPFICYAAKPNSLVVRATGEIAKCTVALYDHRNVVGRLRDDGSVTIDNETLREWYRGFATSDENILSCPLASMGPEDLRERSREPAERPVGR